MRTLQMRLVSVAMDTIAAARAGMMRAEYKMITLFGVEGLYARAAGEAAGGTRQRRTLAHDNVITQQEGLTGASREQFARFTREAVRAHTL